MQQAGLLAVALVGCCLVGLADGFAGLSLNGVVTGKQASGGVRRAASPLSAVSMKDWSKRATLADKAGGVEEKGFAAVGIEGDIPVIFSQKIKVPKVKQPLWRRIIRRPAPTPEEAAMYAKQPKWRRFLRKPAPGTAPEPSSTQEEEGGERMNKLQTMALAGQPLSAVAAQAGQYIKYKCKVGECGTCEVRIDGKWVRTCVAKVPPMEPGTEYKVDVRGAMVEVKGSSAFFSFSSFVAGFRNNLIGMIGFVKEGIKGGKNFEDRINKEKELLAQVAARKAAKAKAAAEKDKS